LTCRSVTSATLRISRTEKFENAIFISVLSPHKVHGVGQMPRLDKPTNRRRLEETMKKYALILATALAASGAAYADSATLVSTDRSSRLVAVDGTRVSHNASGSFSVEAGSRELQFQLMVPSATAPGKSFGYASTPTNHFVTTKADLKAGTHYTLHVDKADLQPKVVIREKQSGTTASLASN
jgi:hypothetical protein